MRIAFFGDSLTSGDNNGGVGFVDKLPAAFSKVKCGVSGTTIGEYPIYPVDNQSLVYQLRYWDIRDYDKVVLEYGINDASAICMEKATLKQVLIDLRRCVDYVKQVYPNAELVFLSLGPASVINEVAVRQIDYLQTDYFKDLLVNSPFGRLGIWNWVSAYSMICECASRLCSTVIPMYNNPEEFVFHLDSDNMHPDDEGYRIIADNIGKTLLY